MISRFVIGASHTLNRGNFNSLRIECSLTVEVPEGDDYEVLKDKAQSELRRLLEETYKAQYKADGYK